MNIVSYLICGTPRSGSTLMCDLLKQTGVAGRPNSFYRRESIDHWIERFGIAPGEGPEFERRYLAAVIQEGTGGTGIFGMRLHGTSLFELVHRLQILQPGLHSDAERIAAAFGTPVYIHLQRRDRVAQAISRLRAEQSGLWHRHADGSERERIKPDEAPVYDAARIAAYIAETEAFEAGWKSWSAAQGITPLEMSYEELSADPKATLAKILIALGRDPAAAERAEVKTAKLADTVSMEWAERFRAE